MPSAETIIQNSVAANERDWQAAPQYSYEQTTRTSDGLRTDEVIMLFGSPYNRLVKINGHVISPSRQRDEQRKFEQAVQERRSESASARANRIASYEKDRRRDHLMMEQLTRAFVFRITGQTQLAGRPVFTLRATPRPGYRPPNIQAEVLPGMKGDLWIDRKTFQWVKVRAQVISPVTIGGFLARVEPGTYFELEKAPVTSDIWLPKRFRMQSHSRVFMMFHHSTQEDDTYLDYHLTPPQYRR